MHKLKLALGVALLAGPAAAQPPPPAMPATPPPATPPPATPGVPFPTRPAEGFKPPVAGTLGAEVAPEPPAPPPLVPTEFVPTPPPPENKIDPDTGAPSFVAGQSIEHWVKELKSSDPTDREAAVKWLRGFGRKAIAKAGGVRLFLPLLDDPDPGVRCNAFITVSLLEVAEGDTKAVVTKVSQSLTKTAPGSVLRVHAANTLAAMGTQADAAIPALIAIADDPAWETRRATALALGRVGAVVFKDVTVSPDGVVTTTTQKVERPPSDPAMRTLAHKLLRDPSGMVRAGAGQALVMMGPPRGTPEEYTRKARPLVDAVATRLAVEKEPSARVWLQLLVVMYDSNQFDAQLRSITNQVAVGDAVTKGQSLLALAMLGPKATSARLTINKALFDPEPAVALAAITALLNLGDDAQLSMTELERLSTVAKDEVLKRAAKDAIEQLRKLNPRTPVARPAASQP